ncbi:Uncharacterised protein [Mycobacteroides abscessus subsp. abscessus]|nr:Uncharacterised protein [Mycobacteroides abscessus subsp. abscessus]
MAGTTVVSARTRLVRNSFASAALANSVSLSPPTALAPQRLVSFINVVACGTDISSGIRQNIRQVIESETSRHKLS